MNCLYRPVLTLGRACYDRSRTLFPWELDGASTDSALFSKEEVASAVNNFASLLFALTALELFGFDEQCLTPSAIISSRTSVSIRKLLPSCVLLGFMCLALALNLPEEMATTPARERLKLGIKFPTARSKPSF